jgi:hypothetical protein
MVKVSCPVGRIAWLPRGYIQVKHGAGEEDYPSEIMGRLTRLDDRLRYLPPVGEAFADKPCSVVRMDPTLLESRGRVTAARTLHQGVEAGASPSQDQSPVNAEAE